MWTRIGALTVTAAVVMLSLGCSQKQSETAAVVIEDKVYPVTPASVSVKAGIVTGQITEMKVTERVEKGSGTVVSPAKLTGTLKLKNNSADQSVRLVGGTIQYVDTQGGPIKLAEGRTTPTIKFATSYNSTDRLNPGEEATQSLDVDFPAAALKAKKLKEIRLDLTYIPSPFKEETVNFTVSIGGDKT